MNQKNINLVVWVPKGVKNMNKSDEKQAHIRFEKLNGHDIMC
jgi:hypothetical protein